MMKKWQVLLLLVVWVCAAGVLPAMADEVLLPMGVFEFSVGIDGNYIPYQSSGEDCSHGAAYITCSCDAETHDIEVAYAITITDGCPLDITVEQTGSSMDSATGNLTDDYNIICRPLVDPLTPGVYPFTLTITARCGENTGSAECIVPLRILSPESDFTWTSDGESVTITGYTGSSVRVAVPDTIQDLPVTAVATEAFYSCDADIISVHLPDGIVSIGEDAFYGCSALSEIYIPEGIQTIGSYAFAECSSLTSVTIPEGITAIAAGTFNACKNLEQVSLPSTVKTLGLASFGGCSSLTEITLPSGMTSIGENAFANCSALASVSIPVSLKGVGAGAFSGCSSLAAVDLPDTLTFMGGSAFYGCRSLQSITIPSGLTAIAEMTFMGCSSLTQVEIPANITEIARYAFSSCASLERVVLQDGVLTIAEHTFGSCEKLSSITLPASLTYISPLAVKSSSSVVASVFQDSYAHTWCVDNDVSYILLSEETTPAPLPDGVSMFNGRYYKIYLGNYTWDQSDEMCRGMDGHLATITSAEEQAFIESINSDTMNLWIGGYRDDEFNWYWVTDETWNYTNWLEGEPNNAGESEECAAVWPTQWNDLDRNNTGEQSGYICEWEAIPSQTVPTLPEPTPTPTPTPVPTPTPEMNPDGALQFGENTYKILTGTYTWDEAEALCTELGGHLATITSAEEQAFIESINPDQLNVWIGGYCDEALDWYWVTGETWDYTNWLEGEPNNSYDEGEDCAAIWPTKWNDMNRNNINEQVGFICEWEMDNILTQATTVILPASLLVVQEESFAGNAAKTIVVNEGCTGIASRAFADCANLKWVILPASIEEITDDAFEGCSDFVVMAPADSYAISYARQIGCSCVELE